MENERWYIKIRDTKTGITEDTAIFFSLSDAEQYKSKLIGGAAGQFGIEYDVWIDSIPEKGETYVSK